MKTTANTHRPAKVMVVEDESKYINSILTAENFENVVAAKTLKDFELLFDLHQPDLIISDICLVENSIFDVILQEKYLKVPMLFIAGVLEDENIGEFSKHQKSIVLPKPLHKYSLLSSIKLLLNVFPPKRKHFLEVLYRNHQVVKISNEDILYIEADGNYTSIHTVNNKVYSRKIPLKQVKNELNNTFIQINKSHIINTHFIKRLELGKGKLSLTNQKVIKIGRVYRKQLDQFILRDS